jgi:hypothetical protein
MRLFLVFLLAALTAGQRASIKFINPPAGGAAGDFSLNPTFVLGSNVNIQWTPTTESISLILLQERPGDTFEYIFGKLLPALPGLMRYVRLILICPSRK